MRLTLRRYSASERLLLSCAMSNLSMTSWAMCSLSLASEIRFLLHPLKALAVVKSLCPNLWKGSVCDVCCDQAFCTTSWNLGSLTQKFSNLKGVGRRSPAAWARSSGQWSECPEESAWRTWLSKVVSHSSLQKNLSRRTTVGCQRSLLQVYFQFCRCISLSSQ